MPNNDFAATTTSLAKALAKPNSASRAAEPPGRAVLPQCYHTACRVLQSSSRALRRKIPQWLDMAQRCVALERVPAALPVGSLKLRKASACAAAEASVDSY